MSIDGSRQKKAMIAQPETPQNAWFPGLSAQITGPFLVGGASEIDTGSPSHGAHDHIFVARFHCQVFVKREAWPDACNA